MDKELHIFNVVTVIKWHPGTLCCTLKYLYIFCRIKIYRFSFLLVLLSFLLKSFDGAVVLCAAMLALQHSPSVCLALVYVQFADGRAMGGGVDAVVAFGFSLGGTWG